MENQPSQFSKSTNTLLPETLEARQRKAESYLDLFSKYTNYQHRKLNPYLRWLKSSPSLKSDSVYHFMNFWFPVSRHQPQILWKIMAAYPDWEDRHLIFQNAWEEDGHIKPGDNPHYDLLEKLIVKLGGVLDVDPEAENLVARFHRSLDSMTPAQATGYVAAIEHPALDISDYFTTITTLCGHPQLLVDDDYLKIHILVEPNHLIWSHGNALDWMQDKEKMARLSYNATDIITAFSHAMSFWDDFWSAAFYKLGYRPEQNSPSQGSVAAD